MKLAALCCFLIIVCSSFAKCDNQISPTIGPDLLTIFFELWRDSAYGKRPDMLEESAWILRMPFGNYSAIRWSRTGMKNLHFWIRPIPNGVVALAHTHTVAADPKPSKQDIALGKRLQIPIYTISEKGIWVVHQGTVNKVLGANWDDTVQIRPKSFPSLNFR